MYIISFHFYLPYLLTFFSHSLSRFLSLLDSSSPLILSLAISNMLFYLSIECFL